MLKLNYVNKVFIVFLVICFNLFALFFLTHYDKFEHNFHFINYKINTSVGIAHSVKLKLKPCIIHISNSKLACVSGIESASSSEERLFTENESYTENNYHHQLYCDSTYLSTIVNNNL